MDVDFRPAVPILRFYDLAATLRFYVDYLGFALDWQEGDGERPTYLQVSRGDLVLHLSSHHDDGTPGTAVLVHTRGIEDLHRALHATGYPNMLPGIEPHDHGRELTVIDPASNRVRFFERHPS